MFSFFAKNNLVTNLGLVTCLIALSHMLVGGCGGSSSSKKKDPAISPDRVYAGAYFRIVRDNGDVITYNLINFQNRGPFTVYNSGGLVDQGSFLIDYAKTGVDTGDFDINHGSRGSYDGFAYTTFTWTNGTSGTVTGDITGEFSEFNAGTAPTEDIFEPDDTFATASTIQPGDTQTRSIHVIDDEDYVSFTLSQERDVVIETSGANPDYDDTDVYLYDDGEILITRNDDGLNGYYSYISATLPAGTYYIMVRSLANVMQINSYMLSLRTSAPAPIPLAPVAEVLAAPVADEAGDSPESEGTGSDLYTE